MVKTASRFEWAIHAFDFHSGQALTGSGERVNRPYRRVRRKMRAHVATALCRRGAFLRSKEPPRGEGVTAPLQNQGCFGWLTGLMSFVSVALRHQLWGKITCFRNGASHCD